MASEAVNRRNREYNRNHPEKAARWKRDAHHRLRNKILLMLGGRCVKCGYDNPRALQIDHVAGDGAEDRRLYRSYPPYYRHVLKDLSKYQLLCANCNALKECEELECHHIRGDSS